jgi:hypothetical protein
VRAISAVALLVEWDVELEHVHARLTDKSTRGPTVDRALRSISGRDVVTGCEGDVVDRAQTRVCPMPSPIT